MKLMQDALPTNLKRAIGTQASSAQTIDYHLVFGIWSLVRHSTENSQKPQFLSHSQFPSAISLASMQGKAPELRPSLAELWSLRFLWSLELGAWSFPR